jgi:hypothetical protein
MQNENASMHVLATQPAAEARGTSIVSMKTKAIATKTVFII